MNLFSIHFLSLLLTQAMRRYYTETSVALTNVLPASIIGAEVAFANAFNLQRQLRQQI